MQPITSFRRRPADLKTALLVHICLVAAACLMAAAIFAAYETRREEVTRATSVAEVVGKQLDLQLLRISASIDTKRRFPDWDVVLAGFPLAGQCVQLYDLMGTLLRSQCIGTPAEESSAPGWFVSAWKQLYGQESSVERAVGKAGERSATLIVSSDQATVAGRAWAQVRQLTAHTALITLVLSTLVYLALARSLSPAERLIGGLEKMTAGDFALRLPPFKLREFDHIGKAANALAAKIETTLGERAELTKQLINSQEDERRSLARELHDEYGQNLAAIAALAASIETSADTAESELALEARTIGNIVGGMMRTLRGTLQRLRPGDVDDFGLDEALRQLVEVWNARRQPTTKFALDVADDIGTLPASTAVHVFRIAQEGLTNAVRHAQATRVDLRLERVAAARPEDKLHLRLTIEDDGKGGDLSADAMGAGMGLLNMRERVAALGGTIDFLRAASGGVRVQVVIPAATAPREARLP